MHYYSSIPPPDGLYGVHTSKFTSITALDSVENVILNVVVRINQESSNHPGLIKYRPTTQD